MKTWILAVLATLCVAVCGAPYPVTESVVDVTRPPYSARGDGVSDDTEAIQRALNDHTGRHHILYFPRGTYLISSTLKWPKKVGDRENWGMTFLCGESRDASVLRLKNGTFTNSTKPEAMMWCGGFGSADWFHNYVENLGFDVGAGNPGAVALQFYSNNSGAVRDCRFVAPVGSGHTGLDLAHRDMNGPLLVRNCEVLGFGRGIATARAVNGQVFENIQLRGQTEVGLLNEGQTVSIRRLQCESSVPAIVSYGTLCLVDAQLIGTGSAAKRPAIVNFNGGRMFLRDVRSTGYRRALGDVSHTPDSSAAERMEDGTKPGSDGVNLAEYSSHPVATLFPSPSQSPRLRVKESPEVPGEDPKLWAKVDDFGADPSGSRDSSEAIQKAIDSGARTVFFPGSYALNRTVVIRGKVRRMVGTGGSIDYAARTKPDFRIVDGDSPVLQMEHFSNIHGGIEVDSARTLVLRSISDCDLTTTARSKGAEWFFEDFVTHRLVVNRQKLWARQLNIENDGPHFINEGGDVWILGYKTERGGTLLETRAGGRSEILGGFSYTTTAGKLAPMFINDESSFWAFFSEVCYNGDPFEVRVSETRGSETRRMKRNAGHTAPYSGRVGKP